MLNYQAPSPVRSCPIGLRIGLRIKKELMPLSSGACGTTRWPGFKVFALCAGYAHTRARLRSVADFCLGKEEGGLYFSTDSTKTRIQIRVRQYCGPLRIRRQR